MKRLIPSSLLCAAFCLAIPAALSPAQAADAEARVKAVWKEHCAQCHGEDGRGRTPQGRKLKLLDYTDPKVQEKFTDAEMIKITQDGVRQGNRVLMKPYKDVLSEDEIKELVAHIRKFAKK
jgi:cytochrome c553